MVGGNSAGLVEGVAEGRGEIGNESDWWRREVMISEGVGKIGWVVMEEKSSERRLLFVSRNKSMQFDRLTIIFVVGIVVERIGNKIKQ